MVGDAQRQHGFDFTAAMRRLCVDVCRRTEELAHIDMSRVAVGFAQARKLTTHGACASLTPLRFPGGDLVQRRRGREYTIQRLFDSAGCELLYILTFYLPRFLELPFDEKLVTVFHELWHVNPSFDGDIRRYDGRCFAHSGSQATYDAHMARLAKDWMALNPPEDLYAFLQGGFRDLVERHGPVYGTRYARPKLIPR